MALPLITMSFGRGGIRSIVIGLLIWMAVRRGDRDLTEKLSRRLYVVTPSLRATACRASLRWQASTCGGRLTLPHRMACRLPGGSHMNHATRIILAAVSSARCCVRARRSRGHRSTEPKGLTTRGFGGQDTICQGDDAPDLTAVKLANDLVTREIAALTLPWPA